MSMNPRSTTSKIKQDYLEYISSILTVKDEEITKLARKRVKDTEFVKGPYLEITLPFKSGKTLKNLAEEGLISKEFEKMGASVHYEDWKLRIHQEIALRKIIQDKRNIVVSTGTGSGKTECYLYPVFNELMREKENGTLDAGVRALLIFPMNALANDQQKKLRKILKDYPDITFGRYTGETPHAKDSAHPEKTEEELHRDYDLHHQFDSDPELRKSIPNEMMCREMMAKNPPHILLTNYAMLEYMLLRPDTAPFFDNESAKHWRFIVIDEAHTYKGATGTEIAFLLRRLKERIRHHMSEPFRCIATSATLGSEDGKEGLAAFAGELFDEPFSAEDVVMTEREKRIIPDEARDFMPEDYIALKEQTEGMEEQERGAFLFRALCKDTRLFHIYEALKNRPKRIEEVSKTIFPDIADEKKAEEALINLIELAAAARKDDTSAALLPARYHLFIKSLEGMFVQYYPEKKVYLDRKEQIPEQGVMRSVFEIADCQKCGQEYLIGKQNFDGKATHLIQTSSADKPEYYFLSRTEDEAFLSEFDEDDVLEESDKMSDLKKYRLCLNCGRITQFDEVHPKNCCEEPDPKKIAVVYNLKYTGKGMESNCCPCCGATREGLLKRFLTANQPATLAVAKSLYDAIPPRPLKTTVHNQLDDLFEDDLFGDTEDTSEETISKEILDESGRKLLIFSDNRQEAAFFAGFFEKKYQLIMWRKVILKSLQGAEHQKLCLTDLISDVMRIADKMGLYSYDIQNSKQMSDGEKREMAAHYVMHEFLSMEALTGLEGMGYISIEPAELKIGADKEFAGCKGPELVTLFRFMMDTLRQKGVVSYPDIIRASDDFFAPRNMNGYFKKSGSRVCFGGFVYGFEPAGQSVNKRLSMMKKLVSSEERTKEENLEEARKNLSAFYDGYFLQLRNNYYIVPATVQGEPICFQLNHTKWNIRYIPDTEKVFRCRKCGRIYSYSLKGFCPELKCDGRLEEVTAKEIREVPYYHELYKDTKIIPMVSREHTAQLSSKTAGEYQKNFEEGKINVLSCSTTFEMGVDVGELEATFLRNVPPETSNYIQRAGRAGRRTSSAAFSVTFSRRNSHDMTYFQSPQKIISGKIAAPVLETKNEKIARRHLNSIVVSWFFRRNRTYFDHQTGSIIADAGGQNMQEALRAELEKRPEDLRQSIHAVFTDDVCRELGVDDWSFMEDLSGENGSLTRAIKERAGDISGLRQYRDSIDQEEMGKNHKRREAANRLIQTLVEEPSISFLSAKGVLPKYGFPIDSVSLDITGGNEESKKIELSRDLKMAISEFAPPAEIVANGKLWKSHAINVVPDRSWPTYIYYVCPECRRIVEPTDGITEVNADLSNAPMKLCPNCSTKMNPKKFIIPIFGFSTKISDKPKPVGETRPKSYYATETQFWGINDRTDKEESEALEKTTRINGKEIQVVYSPGGKLFVLNQGNNGRGINVCPVCGYAADPALNKRGKHRTKYDRECNGALVNVSLGHSFSTDIVRITLPNHPVFLPMVKGMETKNQNLSVLYALLEGASEALSISRDDISGCIYSGNELILYDDTPGGSGFVKHVYHNIEKVLQAARNKVAGQCGCTPETSCYGCLRNYSNQHSHDALSRGLAQKYLDWLLSEVKTEPPAEEPAGSKAEESKKVVFEDTVGNKQYEYIPTEKACSDSATVLRSISEESDSEGMKLWLEQLAELVQGKNLEYPYTDTPLEIEANIWPDLFWPKSKVALFFPESREQYARLKKYDWHCYLVGEEHSPEMVLKNIKETDQ